MFVATCQLGSPGLESLFMIGKFGLCVCAFFFPGRCNHKCVLCVAAEGTIGIMGYALTLCTGNFWLALNRTLVTAPCFHIRKVYAAAV